MRMCCVRWVVGLWVVAGAACADPAPVVLGRLALDAPDGGSDAMQEAPSEHDANVDQQPEPADDDNTGVGAAGSGGD